MTDSPLQRDTAYITQQDGRWYMLDTGQWARSWEDEWKGFLYKPEAWREPMFGYTYATSMFDTDAMKRQVQVEKYVHGLKTGDTVQIRQNPGHPYELLHKGAGALARYLWLRGEAVPCTAEISDVLLPDECRNSRDDWPEVRLTPEGEVSIETIDDEPILLSLKDARFVHKELGALLERVPELRETA